MMTMIMPSEQHLCSMQAEYIELRGPMYLCTLYLTHSDGNMRFGTPSLSCSVSSLVETPLFRVHDIFVIIVIVNVVGSRTITAIETDDVVGTKAYQRACQQFWIFYPIANGLFQRLDRYPDGLLDWVCLSLLRK